MSTDDEKAAEKKIKRVIVFENGMVAVFDHDGNQIPELQGKWSEKYQGVFIMSDAKTEIQMAARWEDEK